MGGGCKVGLGKGWAVVGTCKALDVAGEGGDSSKPGYQDPPLNLQTGCKDKPFCCSPTWPWSPPCYTSEAGLSVT